MYSSTLVLTSELDGVGGQRHAPAALPPGKTRYPLYRRLVGPQGRCRRVRKISPPTGIRSPDRPARSESLYRLRYPGSWPLLYLTLLKCSHIPAHTRATSIPTLNSLYHVSVSFLLMVLSQAATSSLHEAEVLHPVVLGEQINEQDGRLNPTVVLNLCLYCGLTASSYMFRLSCHHLQGVFLYREVNVITCMCPCGLRS
jgi:hypothetical protein